MGTASATMQAISGGMASPDRPSPPKEVQRTRRLRAPERALASLEGFVSACGLAGGAYMASHPMTVMPIEYLRGTWFDTWRWPGLFLFFFVGVCPALVVIATLLRLRVAALGHLCVGVGLVAWILLEATWVVVSPGLQLAVGAIGTAILVLGVRELAFSKHRLAGERFNG